MMKSLYLLFISSITVLPLILFIIYDNQVRKDSDLFKQVLYKQINELLESGNYIDASKLFQIIKYRR